MASWRDYAPAIGTGVGALGLGTLLALIGDRKKKIRNGLIGALIGGGAGYMLGEGFSANESLYQGTKRRDDEINRMKGENYSLESKIRGLKERIASGEGKRKGLEDAISSLNQRISASGKNNEGTAVRSLRLMRDIAGKLGVEYDRKSGLNDIYGRIVGALESGLDVPKLISDIEQEHALKETTWKDDFGKYFKFLNGLQGKRVVPVPAR